MSSQKREQKKKPYQPPQMVVYGNIREITQTAVMVDNRNDSMMNKTG